MNKKILLILLLTTSLVVGSCTTPYSPMDEIFDSTIEETTPVIAESTTPGDVESTTPGDVESTTPQESESDTTAPEDTESSGTDITDEPEVLFEVLAEIPDPTGYGWLKSELQKYTVFPQLNELTPIYKDGDKDYCLLTPFDHPSGNFTHATLDHLQHYGIPIEYITLTDSKHACVVLKIEDEATGEHAYLYQMYEQRVYEKGTGIHRRMYEEYLLITEGYWSTNNLKYSDCSVLKPGDSIETVKALIPHIGWAVGVLNGIPFLNCFLLEDGVLYIKLETTDFTDYFVEDIQFYPNGTDAEIYGQPLTILKAENRPPLPGADA